MIRPSPELPDLDTENLESWPARIWLQHGAAEIPNYAERPRLEDGITWCEDNTDPLDVEYVRADLSRRTQPEGEARPTDDKLWDETLRDRDTYHEWADKLAGAIAIHFGVDIGEHSNANCPWHEALEAILSAPDRAEGEAPQAVYRAVIEEAAQVFESGAAHNRKAGRTVFAHAQQDRADRLRATLSAPAAQHAESGAPVELPSNEELESVWENHVGHPADFAADVLQRWGGWPPGLLGYGGKLAAALTAQSQGAQAAMTAIARRDSYIAELESRAAQQAAAPGDLDERQAFESTVRTWDVPADALERWPDGRYVQEQIEQCWSGWESRSKLSPSAPGTPQVDRFHWSKRGMELDPNGYYVAYSAPGTPEAPNELGLDVAVAVNQRLGKYIAANKPALMLLNGEELAALYRFQETCEDSDSGGYDVDKEMMKRLAAIGVIESKGFGRYQFTDFGDFVVERAAQLDGGQGEEVSHG